MCGEAIDVFHFILAACDSGWAIYCVGCTFILCFFVYVSRNREK